MTPAADNTTAVSGTSDPSFSLSYDSVVSLSGMKLNSVALGVHNSLDIVNRTTTFGDDCPGVWEKVGQDGSTHGEDIGQTIKD